MKTQNHPSQPVEIVDGVIRFKKNKIVDWMLEEGTRRGLFDLNKLYLDVQRGQFSKDDYDQLMQLIGYSVSGYGGLDTSNKQRASRAQKRGMQLLGE